ncbi:MAG: VCBS repeat-containing protein [Bacteroidota bacterium]
MGSRSSPQLVDVDEDSDLDLIGGNSNGEILYYQNLPTCLPASVDGYVDCAMDAFDGINVGYESTPQLVDVDGDSDLDLISGENNGVIRYYQNDGSGNYVQQTGTANPFDGIDVGSFSTPQLMDVDGDSDLDLISGEFNGAILYYQNDGSGNYTQVTGTANPLDGIDVGSYSTPQLVDVDGDGDLDLISGELYGAILYYQNDGSGNYVQQTGTANPFDGINVGYLSTPQLVDVDGDSDLDLISGEYYGAIRYYQNDGSGNYMPQTGTANPFDGIDVGNNSKPRLVDVDGDSDLDLIIGERFDAILYYQNTDLSVSASTAACVSNEGEVELTVASTEEEGPYNIYLQCLFGEHRYGGAVRCNGRADDRYH